MLYRSLTLHHFRNVAFARLEFSGRRHFLLGANGQGKTNLLEAAGFPTALRSFRTSDAAVLRQTGAATGSIACDVEHERLGEVHLLIRLHREGKEVWCDRERVKRLADHLGKFPTVVFSSQDMSLVRGSPSVRRRWIDLTLAAMDGAYLAALQAFAKALAARNSLLRRAGSSDRELAAFEEPLAESGATLIRIRASALHELGSRVQAAHARIGDGAEAVAAVYEPNFAEGDAGVLLARLEAGRAKDRQFRTTLAGPHRDDLALKVSGCPARDYGSEGQQRCLALSLRLAQADWFRERSGVRPILLADDVLGELDPDRRMRFWGGIDPEAQVIATGTRPPEKGSEDWQTFRVKSGTFEAA
jgi:DNA replication and repair protein RecF